MNKKLSRKQEEELRRRRMPRYAEVLGAELAFSSAAPYAPRPASVEQSQSLGREEEQVRRAWALSSASVQGVHRSMGNSAVRSILGGQADFASREPIEPGKALLASLLARDVISNDAAGGAIPGSGGSEAGSSAAAPADAHTGDGDALHRDADETIARDSDDDRIVVRDNAAGIDVAYDPSGGAPDVNLKQVKEAMGAGQPLDASTREYMEWRFGLSLGNVRIHSGPKADALSRALMAHAFALGADVNFAAGQYKPGTKQGDFLLAHEIAHVVQAGHATEAPAPQAPADQGPRKSSSVSEPDDAIEVEADQVASEVVAVGRSEFAKAKREGATSASVKSAHTPSPTARKAARLGAAPASGARRAGPGSKIARDDKAGGDKAKAELNWPRMGKEVSKTWRKGKRFEVKGKIKYGAAKASAVGKAKVPTAGPTIKADVGKAKLAFDATKGASSLALKLGEVAMASEVLPGITVTWAKLGIAEYKFGANGEPPDFTALKVSASIKGDATNLFADPSLGLIDPSIAPEFKKRYKIEVELEISAKPTAADLKRLAQFAKEQGKIIRAAKAAAAAKLEKAALLRKNAKLAREARKLAAARKVAQAQLNAATKAANGIAWRTKAIPRIQKTLEMQQKNLEKAAARAAKATTKWEKEAAEKAAKFWSKAAKESGEKLLGMQDEVASARKILANGKPSKFKGIIAKIAERGKAIRTEKLANSRAAQALGRKVTQLKGVITKAASKSKTILKAMKGPIAKAAAKTCVKAVGKALLKVVPVLGWILTAVDVVDLLITLGSGNAQFGFGGDSGSGGAKGAEGGTGGPGTEGVDGGVEGGASTKPGGDSATPGPDGGVGGGDGTGTGGDGPSDAGPSDGADAGPGGGSGGGSPSDGGVGPSPADGGTGGDGGKATKPGGGGDGGKATEPGSGGDGGKGPKTDQGGTGGGAGGEELTVELFTKLLAAPADVRALWAALTEADGAQTPINNAFVKGFLDATGKGVSETQIKTIVSHLGAGKGDPAKVLEIIKGGISGDLKPKEGKDDKPPEGFDPSDPAHGWGGLANKAAAEKVAKIIRGIRSHAFASPPTIEGIGEGRAIIYSVTGKGTQFAQMVNIKVVGNKLIIGSSRTPPYTAHAKVLGKKHSWGGMGEFVEDADKAGFVRDKSGNPPKKEPGPKPDIQGKAAPGTSDLGDVHEAARLGLASSPGPLPEVDVASFGVAGVQRRAARSGAPRASGSAGSAVQRKLDPVQRVPVTYIESHKSMFQLLEDATAGLTQRQHGALQSSLKWTGNLFAYAVMPSPQWDLLFSQCEMLEQDLLNMLGGDMTAYATVKLAPALQSTYAARGLVEGGMKPNPEVAKAASKHVTGSAFALGQLAKYGVYVDDTGNVRVQTDEELDALIEKSVKAEPKPPDMPVEQWEGGLNFKPYTVVGTEIRVSNKGGEDRFKQDHKPLSPTQVGTLTEMKALMYRDSAFDEGPVTRDRLIDMRASIDKWKSTLEQLAGEGIGTKVAAVVARCIAKLEVAHGMVLAKLQPLPDLLTRIQGTTASIQGAIQNTLDIRPFKEDENNPDQARIERWRREFGDEGENPVQRKASGTREDSVHAAAERGTAGPGGKLPFFDVIQGAFGGHDVSDISAHVGSRAAEAAADMGALAFATGNAVVFGSGPDLHTAAHEAAHVVQQRGGVNLPGGVGSVGDVYERHADAVADAVVRGGSAEGLLDSVAGGSAAKGVQAKALTGPVQMDGEEGPVLSIQTGFWMPVTERQRAVEPSTLTTYDDASTLAGNCWEVLDGVTMYMDSADPKYGSMLDAQQALDDKASAWAGDADRLVLSDGQALSAIIATAENELAAFTADLSECWIAADWDFQKIRVRISGDLRLAFQSDVAALARRVPARLQPILDILNNGPSPFATPLEAEIAKWRAIEGSYAAGHVYSVASTFGPVFEAWDSTEALLWQLEQLPVRGQPIALGRPFDSNGTYDISTFEAAATFAGDVDSDLFFRHSEMFPSDSTHRYKDSYQEWRDEWNVFANEIGEWGRTAGDWQMGISDAEATLIGNKVRDLERHIGWVQDAFRNDVISARRDAAAARRDANEAKTAAEFALRSAFLSNQSNPDIAFIGSTITGLVGLAGQINTVQQALGGWGGGPVDQLLRGSLPNVASKGLSVANLIINWSSETNMTRGSGFEGLAALNNAVSAMGIVATPTIALFTAHIGPMLSAITALLGRLQVQLIRLNDLAAEMGMDGQYYPGADPGGEPMWVFMTAVMHAGGSGGVPTPNSAIVDYFESARSQFGAAADSDVPMDSGVLGTGFFQDLDVESFKAWVYSKRSTVWACLYGGRPVPVQRSGEGSGSPEVVQAAAQRGTAGAGGSLPYGAQIQKAFGSHDVSDVKAHTGPAASAAAKDMGARAYAMGTDVAFGGTPDLHTAAHEAAHVVQQKAGVSLKGDVGQAGDKYEKHADLVADAVVAGRSAEPLLSQVAGGGTPSSGVQRKAVQMDGGGKPTEKEKATLSEAGPAVAEAASAAPPPGAPVNPTPAPVAGPPAPAVGGGGGSEPLLTLDPYVPDPGVCMPEYQQTPGAGSTAAVIGESYGPIHNEPAAASEGLLSASWHVATDAFGPLIGYNRHRGGFSPSNALNIGPGIDRVIDTYKNDRGEGVWAKVGEIASNVRAVAETIRSICSAVGLVTRVLSLVGLFPPLAPVGAFLASVSSLCSTITWITAIIVTVASAITTVASAIQLVQGVKSGSPNVAKLYAQYQSDVSNFVADGIGLATDALFKKFGPSSSKPTTGMKNYKDVLKTVDGRSARGGAFQALKNLGTPNLAGNLLSTAGSTRAALTGMLRSELTRVTVTKITSDVIKRGLKHSLRKGGRSMGSDIAALTMPDDIVNAASRVKGAKAGSKAADRVSSAVGRVPEQTPAPVIPEPAHTTTEADQVSARRTEVAGAREHVGQVRGEGLAAIEAGEGLVCEADEHDAAAIALDAQVDRHTSGVDQMESDASEGIAQIDKGEKEANKGKEQGQKVENEGESAKAEGDGVSTPKPKPATSWWGRLKQWFKEKVFKKVGEAMDKVKAYIADMIMKAVAGVMGVDDIDAQLAGAKQEIEAAQDSNQETRQGTASVSRDASKAHADAAAAAAAGKDAIARGQATVAEANALDAQLQAEEAKLAAEEQNVRASTAAWQDQHGADVNLAAEGGAPVDGAVLGGLEAGVDAALDGVDGLEDDAAAIGEIARDGLMAQAAAHQVDADMLAPFIGQIESSFCDLSGRMDGRRGRLAGLGAQLGGLAGQPYALVEAELARITGEIHSIAGEADADFEAFRDVVAAALEEAAAMWAGAGQEVVDKKRKSGVQAKKAGVQRKAAGEDKVQKKAAPVQLKGDGDERMELKSTQRDLFKTLGRIVGKKPAKAPKRKVWVLVKATCANWSEHLEAEIKPDAKITKQQAAIIQSVTTDPLRSWFDRTAAKGKLFERDLKKAFKLLKTPKFIGGAEEQQGEGVQRKGDGSSDAIVHAAAAAGTAGSGGSLPFGSQIQKSFGSHDVSGVSAHTGPDATAASKAMGASAFATGNDVAFAGSPDLHTTAHEAAHVVQQRSGVSLAGGVGQVGDKYEQHADAVADAVVAGKSAEPILNAMAGAGKFEGVQRSQDDVQLKGAGSFSYVEAGAFGGRASFDVQMKISAVNHAPVQMEDGPACTPGESTDGAAVFLPNAVAAVGEVAYYQQRHDDFGDRYPDGPAPPTYYLGYGGKYVARFTTELYPKLSPAGQAWLVQTRINLQVAIENRRAADPAAFDALEKNDPAFTAFAYGTHADAYINAGLKNLNAFDLARVGLTPDVQDLLTREGIAQAAEVGVRLIPLWGADAIDFINGEGTTEEMQRVMIEGYEVVGDGIDYIWGEGTSQQVNQTIETTARLAADVGGQLYDGAYDLAEEKVSEWVNIVDGAYGEGTSVRAANALRQRAQEAVDEIESAWDYITPW